MVPEILIVDDDQMMLDLLEIFLERCGYNVTRAAGVRIIYTVLNDLFPGMARYLMR